MDVAVSLADVSEERLLCNYLRVVQDQRRDVEVLKRPTEPRVDDQFVAADDVGGSGHHRIDSRSVRGRDVDAVVKGEFTGSLDAVVEEGEREDRARVAEVRADRMLLVKRPHRPRVGPGARRREEREQADHDEKREAVGHWLVRRNRPGQG